MLSDRTSNYINWATSKKSLDNYSYDSIVDFGTPVACPKEFCQRFKALPNKEIVQNDIFIKREDASKSFCGTTWMNAEVALGTVSRECFWTQRRPFLGYWNNEAGAVSVLKLRMLKDGKDFACGGVHNIQDKNKVLTGVKMYIDRGDFHLFLDGKSDGCFKLKSLILRYQLADEDAIINDLGGNRHELISGGWKAVITALPSTFNGCPLIWQIGRTDDVVHLDAVLYEGEEINLCLNESLLTELVIATEVIKKDDLPTQEFPSFRYTNSLIEAKWQNMKLLYNPYGEKY